MDAELNTAVERTWLELQEHFERFFEDMAALEQVMRRAGRVSNQACR